MSIVAKRLDQDDTWCMEVGPSPGDFVLDGDCRAEVAAIHTAAKNNNLLENTTPPA